MYPGLNLLRRTPRVALSSRARLNTVGHGSRNHHVGHGRRRPVLQRSEGLQMVYSGFWEPA